MNARTKLFSAAFVATFLIVFLLLAVDFALWERFTVAGSGVSIVSLLMRLTTLRDFADTRS